MRIYFYSDSHGQHNRINIPKDIDVAVFCGDCSNHPNPYQNENEIRLFMEWYRRFPAKHKLMTWGNHDTSAALGLIDGARYPEITILNHSGVTINGLNFFGSPWTPRFGEWAFMKNRNKMSVIWDSIPDDVDVLFSHGPPKGILDLALDIDDRKTVVQVGCKSLYNRVRQINPKIHAFGHIHQSKELRNYGVFKDGGDTTFINCAVASHADNIIRPGFVLEL